MECAGGSSKSGSTYRACTKAWHKLHVMLWFGACKINALIKASTFFYKKDKKMRLNWPKILRKSQENHEAQFQNLVFLLAKNRCFVIIAFKVLKTEFKIRVYRRNRKCNPFWPVYVSKS